MHSPGTGNTLLPGEVDLPAELQMPPSMQHMYHWEAPDGNQFIMDPLAAATSTPGAMGGGAYAGGVGGVGAPGLDPGAPPWQPGHPHRLGDQLYALGGYDGGGQLSTVESLDTQTGMWRYAFTHVCIHASYKCVSMCECMHFFVYVSMYRSIEYQCISVYSHMCVSQH
jgi:hypothetical protein